MSQREPQEGWFSEKLEIFYHYPFHELHTIFIITVATFCHDIITNWHLFHNLFFLIFGFANSFVMVITFFFQSWSQTCHQSCFEWRFNCQIAISFWCGCADMNCFSYWLLCETIDTDFFKFYITPFFNLSLKNCFVNLKL